MIRNDRSNAYAWMLGLALMMFLTPVARASTAVTGPSAEDSSAGKQPDVTIGKHQYEMLCVSPDHRFALVWRIRNQEIDFNRFDSDGDYKDKLVDGGQFANYIVDLKQQRVVAEVDGCGYFPGQNDSDAMVTWGPDDRYAVVVWQSKWQPNEVFFVTIAGRHAGAQRRLYDSFRYCLRPQLPIAAGVRLSPTFGLFIWREPYYPQIIVGVAGDDTRIYLSGTVNESKSGTGWTCGGDVVYRIGPDGRLDRRAMCGQYAWAASDGGDIWLVCLDAHGKPVCRREISKQLQDDVLRRDLKSTRESGAAEPTGFGDTDSVMDVQVQDKRTDKLTYTADYTYRIEYDGGGKFQLRRVGIAQEHVSQ
jgi:hypothetical protein